MTLVSWPYSRPALPFCHAPVARITWLYPRVNRLWISFTSVLRFTRTPMALSSFSSLSMAWPLMRNSGITWRTMPPRASFRSKTVTSTPARPRKKAAAMPAGPPPTTATFRPGRGEPGRSLGSSWSKPPSAAFSFCCRMYTLSS